MCFCNENVIFAAVMKILVIDDNAGVRASLKLVLSDEFDEIATVGDPRLIPALLSGGNTDAVLLDMNFGSDRLDGSDGLFWLRRIKDSPSAPAVVLITAFGDVTLAVEGMKLGAEDFITKPWDNDALIAKLRDAIEKNRASRRVAESVENAREVLRRDKERQEMTLEEIRLQHAYDMVAQCGGNISAAAEKLGVNRQTLYNILKKK